MTEDRYQDTLLVIWAVLIICAVAVIATQWYPVVYP